MDVSDATFTQEDPLGLAGGLNLYGFAGGDPVNFSDPFGLCRDNDQVCRDLVDKLRGQDGAKFQTAADAYDATDKQVFMVPGDHKALGGPGGPNRDGRETTWTLGATTVGAVYLNSEQSEGDLLITAVHEAEEHFAQPVPMFVEESGWLRRAGDTYEQLTPALQAQAPRWATRLYNQGIIGFGPAVGAIPREKRP
jgi:hypothetical protein